MGVFRRQVYRRLSPKSVVTVDFFNWTSTYNKTERRRRRRTNPPSVFNKNSTLNTRWFLTLSKSNTKKEGQGANKRDPWWKLPLSTKFDRSLPGDWNISNWSRQYNCLVRHWQPSRWLGHQTESCSLKHHQWGKHLESQMIGLDCAMIKNELWKLLIRCSRTTLTLFTCIILSLTDCVLWQFSLSGSTIILWR